MTRNHFPKKSSRKTDILDLIHSDVCGPMRVASLGGSKYFVQFIDDHSRWGEIRFLKSKDEVLAATKEVINLFETQTERKVKCLHSDNGREYLNEASDVFLKKRGITRRLTIPHNPEQNGISERRNRTIVEMARCLLLQSGLPRFLWGEAVNTANYLRNRCPSKSLNGKTPYEMWKDQAPDVSQLCEFGCRVLVLNRGVSSGKFDDKCNAGHFVGYYDQIKGYRIWIPDGTKIISSRDVKFFENEEHQLGSLEDVFPENVEDLVEENPCNRSDVDHIDVDIIVPSYLDEEPDEEPENQQDPLIRNNNARRARGRPRAIKTGLRGRPRLEYQPVVNNATINECD